MSDEWVLVPREPTQEQIKAVEFAIYRYSDCDVRAAERGAPHAYRAFLAASPAPPEGLGSDAALSPSAGDARSKEARPETGPWQVTNEYDGYEKALAEFAREFPGWWLTGGACNVSCHCSIGPDANGWDAILLADRLFDEGFHADIAQPCKMIDAVFAAMDEARKAKWGEL